MDSKPNNSIHSKHNVFLVKPSLCPEDRFTGHWCCLLKNEPKLAQSVIDRLMNLAGRSSPRLLDVIDHPGGVFTERVDCLLRTKDFDILCEHKLNAAFGKSQLERYLSLAKSKKSRLLVITNQRMQIPAAVQKSQHYIKPQAGNLQHFLWSDLYPVVSRARGNLCRQFKGYMDHLGMNPWNWGRFGDPFADASAAEAFRRLYNPLVDQLWDKGITTVRRSNSLGLQIKYPIPKVSLLYAAPSKWDGSLWLPLSGRLFQMTIWTEGDRAVMKRKEECVKGKGPKLYTTWLDKPAARWKPNVFAERNYYASLDEILVSNASRSSENIADVIQRAIRDMTADLIAKNKK